MGIAKNLSVTILPLALCACVFFGPDRIGGRIICDVSGETGETCFLDYGFDDVFQSTGYIDVTKDFSRELDGVGTVLRAGDTYGIRYVGNINDCAKSSQVALVAAVRKVFSEGPEDFSEPYVMSPKEFAKFEAIKKLGPRFRDIKEVQVRFGRIVQESISEDVLRELIYKNLNSLPVVCRSWLKEDTHIVTNTLVVEAMEYKFKGSFNRTIFVNKENLQDFVTFLPSLKYEVMPVGTIQVNDPHDVAIGGSIAIEAFGFEPEPLHDVLSRYYIYIERYSKID